MIWFFCLIGAGALTVAGAYAVAGGNAYGWILVLLFVPAFLACVFQPRIKRARESRRLQEQGRIWVKDDILVFAPPGELKQTFALADIEEIRVVTSDPEALYDDLFWKITAAGQTITVPGDIIGADTLLEAFGTLPQFDVQKASEAFAGTRQAEFVLLDTKIAVEPAAE